MYLGLMAAAMFAVMYGLMYAMVDRLENVYSNINQFYMAGLMTAPMILLELAIMRTMYKSRAANAAIVAVCVLAFAGSWIGIRGQIGVTDNQFLRSMIPHHASAVLMCEEAPVQDREVRSLCQNIVRSQQAEIEQMKAIFARRDHAAPDLFGGL
jgi:hypothetical protein